MGGGSCELPSSRREQPVIEAPIEPMPAVRDIIVTGIYVVMLGLNVFLFAAWQKRNVVVEKPAEDATPVKRSRFGRPLRRGTGRGAAAPAPEGV